MKRFGRWLGALSLERFGIRLALAILAAAMAATLVLLGWQVVSAASGKAPPETGLALLCSPPQVNGRLVCLSDSVSGQLKAGTPTEDDIAALVTAAEKEAHGRLATPAERRALVASLLKAICDHDCTSATASRTASSYLASTHGNVVVVVVAP